ncbi:hypothetical protein BCF46_2157 [Litoreibacter meonggei]|uniref:Uncharacterized protein n=1 Tax=Litoreibacter meonggei TaxID=1049199 RepID=A0A497W7H1_9RHOB|nr:hypothetical protein [Litoreibacter meonggei]RLJ51932.1 hypothetical protein BCF46_2157 [Litoreibacter meonggei]
MTRQFIAALLSLSLGFSAMTTAPARADEDVVKIIAGLALLGILANAAKKNDRQVVTQNQHRPHHVKPKRQRHDKKVAPRRCLREQWTHRGKREVYSARCMKNNARHALPRNCKRTIDTRNGVRKFYAPRCLRRNGWNA